MTWFNFPGWGDYNLNGVSEKELVLTGAHGYATKAQADAKPNASPSPDQQLLLQGFNAASISPVGAAGGSGVLSTPHGTGGVSGALTNAFTLKTTGDWRHFTTRAVEVALGGILILVAANSLTKNQGIVQTAKQLGKKVPL